MQIQMTAADDRAAAGDRGGVPREPRRRIGWRGRDATPMTRRRRSRATLARRRSRCTSACARDPAPVAARRPPRSWRRSRRGGKLLLFGNGGSAAGRAARGGGAGRAVSARAARRCAAIALTTDTSILTSDRQRLRRSSGCSRGRSRRSAGRATWRSASPRAARSPNVLRGAGGGAGARTEDDRADRPRRRRDRAGRRHSRQRAVRRRRARVQEVHRTLLHVICDLVERASWRDAMTRADA